MRRLFTALIFATVLGFGCAETHYDHEHDRYARDHMNRCEAPAVGVCAGCEVVCRGDDQPTCTPGRSVPAQGQQPGYCSEESVCRCTY
jgi:hypothetical protein